MCFVVAISFSGLHSIIEICVCGNFVDGGMNLVSRSCAGVKCVCYDVFVVVMLVFCVVFF